MSFLRSHAIVHQIETCGVAVLLNTQWLCWRWCAYRTVDFLCRDKWTPDLIPFVTTAVRPSVANHELLRSNRFSSRNSEAFKDDHSFTILLRHTALGHEGRQLRRVHVSKISVARSAWACNNLNIDANGILTTLSCGVRGHSVSSERNYHLFWRLSYLADPKCRVHGSGFGSL